MIWHDGSKLGSCRPNHAKDYYCGIKENGHTEQEQVVEHLLNHDEQADALHRPNHFGLECSDRHRILYDSLYGSPHRKRHDADFISDFLHFAQSALDVRKMSAEPCD